MDKSQSEIIRDAIDEYARRRSEDTRIALLRSGWKLFSEEDLQEEDTDSPQISAITGAELYAKARTPEKQERLARFISAFTGRTVNAEIARLGGIRRGSYCESHGTDLADEVIGATAEYEDLELVTRNERHFPWLKTSRPY